MSGSYDKQGIQFLFPENWRITDEETEAWPRTVSVQSPSGGFWSLMVYEDQIDPDALTEEVVAAMRLEYEDLEVVPAEELLDGAQAAGYDMHFYCLDFVVHARTLAVQTGTRTMLLMWQAEDREFEEFEPVFRAISISLLREAP